ncbi:MAG: TonB-dependent receptor [Verrucomicrobiota bacterium]
MIIKKCATLALFVGFFAFGSLAETEENAMALGLVHLPTTVLVGTRTELEPIDVAGNVVSYSGDDLLFSGATGFDDFIEVEPLVSAILDFSAADPTVPYNSGGSGSYTIRGVGGNRVSIFIDGVRQPLEVDFQVGGIAINSTGRDYFDPAIFETVEIFKGTASSLYGSDALAGVVAFTTPSPSDFVEVDSGESFFGYRFQYSSASENFSNVVTGAFNQGPLSVMVIYARRDFEERENSADFVDDYLPEPNPVDGESDSILARAEYYIDDDQSFEFTVEGFFRETEIDVNSVERTSVSTGSFDLSDSVSRTGTFTSEISDALGLNERERLRVSAGYTYEGNAGLFDKIQALLYHQAALSEDFYTESLSGRFVGDTAIPQILAVDSVGNIDTSYEENTTGIGLTFEDTLDFTHGSHRVLFGFDGTYGNSEIPFDTFGSSVVTESQNFNTGDPEFVLGFVNTSSESRPRLPETETLRLGTFLQDEFTFGDASEWTLIGGIRFDYYSLESEDDEDFRAFVGTDAPDYDDFSISPSLALLRRIDDETSVFASYRQGFRNPTPVEISGGFVHPPGADFRTAPNPELEAEISYAFELGLKHYSDNFRFSASVFYTFYKDFINFPTPTDDFVMEGSRNFRLYRPQNVDSVDVYGYEVFAEASLGLLDEDFERWFMGTSFGRAFGEMSDENEGVEMEQPLVTVDPFQWVQYVEYRGDRVRAKLIGTFVDDKTQLGDPSLIPTESYYTVDLRFSFRLTEGIVLGFGVNNLTDQKYTEWQSVQNNIHGTRQDQLELFQRATEPGSNFFMNCTFIF